MKSNLILASIFLLIALFLLGSQTGDYLYLAFRSFLRGIEGFSYLFVFQLSLLVGLGLGQIGKRT